MKNLILYVLLMWSSTAWAQPLKTIALPPAATIHILSPEPIQYVDISSADLIGDLPLSHVLRLKYKDSLGHRSAAVVTITGERFLAQYKIQPGGDGPSQVDILPEDMHPLDISGVGFSTPQLRSMALRLFSSKPGKKVTAVNAFGLKGRIHHIYTAGDYIFIDLGLENQTNLRYNLDVLRFKMEDKKVTKAENNQSVELHPEMSLFNIPEFTRHYRNIFVLKKISFPGNKRLLIEIGEKPISGRVLTLRIAYQDILDADVIPF